MKKIIKYFSKPYLSRFHAYLYGVIGVWIGQRLGLWAALLLIIPLAGAYIIDEVWLAEE